MVNCLRCGLELTQSGCHVGRWFGLTFTFTLVVGPLLCYETMYIAPQWNDAASNHTVVVALFVSTMTFGTIAIFSLIRTCFTHPGRVPPAYYGTHVRPSLNMPEGAPDGSVSTHPLLQNIAHCEYCDVYKLGGTHHCSRCGECIHRMDHHCPWIGQCVGRDNHKFFLLFLFYTAVTALIIAISSAKSVFSERIHSGDTSSQRENDVHASSFLIVHCVGCVCGVWRGAAALPPFCS